MFKKVNSPNISRPNLPTIYGITHFYTLPRILQLDVTSYQLYEAYMLANAGVNVRSDILENNNNLNLANITSYVVKRKTFRCACS